MITRTVTVSFIAFVFLIIGLIGTIIMMNRGE